MKKSIIYFISIFVLTNASFALPQPGLYRVIDSETINCVIGFAENTHLPKLAQSALNYDGGQNVTFIPPAPDKTVAVTLDEKARGQFSIRAAPPSINPNNPTYATTFYTLMPYTGTDASCQKNNCFTMKAKTEYPGDTYDPRNSVPPFECITSSTFQQVDK